MLQRHHYHLTLTIAWAASIRCCPCKVRARAHQIRFNFRRKQRMADRVVRGSIAFVQSIRTVGSWGSVPPNGRGDTIHRKSEWRHESTVEQQYQFHSSERGDSTLQHADFYAPKRNSTESTRGLMKISEDDDGDGGFLSFWHKGDEEEEDTEKKKDKVWRWVMLHKRQAFILSFIKEFRTKLTTICNLRTQTIRMR